MAAPLVTSSMMSEDEATRDPDRVLNEQAFHQAAALRKGVRNLKNCLSERHEPLPETLPDGSMAWCATAFPARPSYLSSYANVPSRVYDVNYTSARY